MTGIERRRHERIRARFPCEVELNGKRGAGTVRDLSAGGLCVQTELPAEEGDEVRLRLHPKGRPSLEVQALVWNLHAMRDRRSGERSTRLGLVLSDASDAFVDLLGSGRSAAPAERPAPTRAEPPAAAQPSAENAPGAPERGYRVRVRQSATSRTCTLVVFACCAEEATAAALEETGDGWSVLGVKRQQA